MDMSDGRVRYARNGDARIAYRMWGKADTTVVFPRAGRSTASTASTASTTLLSGLGAEI
jgi:hypothetical protein